VPAEKHIPDARSGLPKPLERRLLKPYADTMMHRMEAAAAVRALGVLIRKHPRAALDMLGSGLAQAGRVGIKELKRKFSRAPRKAERPAPIEAPRPEMAKLTKKELRKLCRALAEADKPENDNRRVRGVR
jgi:hypothetical protein